MPEAVRPRIAVVDIDGVVADVRHRLHHVRTRPPNWGAFFAAAAGDPPLDAGVARVRELLAAPDVDDVLWLTGRPEHLRDVTTAWLAGQGLPVTALLMRPAHDRRPARMLKPRLLREIAASADVVVVVDDDAAVVEQLRADGWPVELADWMDAAPTLRRAQEADGRT